MGGGEQKDGGFYYAPFCSNGNKTKQFFVLLLQLHTGWMRGDICSGIPAHTPERLWRFSSSEIERLINVPLTALGLKKKQQHTHATPDVCAGVCAGASSSAQYAVRYLHTATCLYEGSRQTSYEFQ